MDSRHLEKCRNCSKNAFFLHVQLQSYEISIHLKKKLLRSVTNALVHPSREYFSKNLMLKSFNIQFIEQTT